MRGKADVAEMAGIPTAPVAGERQSGLMRVALIWPVK